MNKKVMAVIGVSLVLLSANPVLARGGRDMGPGRPGAFFPGADVERLGKELNLSADQASQIKALLEAERPQITALMDEMREQRQQLRQAEEATTFDEEAVRTIATAMAQVEIERTIARVKIQTEINAILSAEQLAQLQTLRAAERRQPPPPLATPGE